MRSISIRGSAGAGELGVRPSVRREKVLVFRGIDVTLQMFHPPTLVPGQKGGEKGATTLPWCQKVGGTFRPCPFRPYGGFPHGSVTNAAEWSVFLNNLIAPDKGRGRSIA